LLVLGIESSCDETAAAVVKNGKKILSNVIFSQIPVHADFGGIVPEIASRNHVVSIIPVVDMAIFKASVKLKEIDAIAVTTRPGLIGSLLVGLCFAKGLAYSLDKPLIGINHIEAHIFAATLTDNLKPPFIALVVSGGHTNLYYVKDWKNYELLGKTRDDAAGEAFDKGAKLLGLPYPGGENIDRLAKCGNALKFKFPIPRISNKTFDFSFSGLKTSLATFVKSKDKDFIEANKADIAASYQRSIIEVLVEKTIRAALQKGEKTIIIAGGVAANSLLREKFKNAADNNNLKVIIPAPSFCTDNAVMVAAAGYFQYKSGDKNDLFLNAFSYGEI